jgi:hypothetical protein
MFQMERHLFKTHLFLCSMQELCRRYLTAHLKGGSILAKKLDKRTVLVVDDEPTIGDPSVVATLVEGAEQA